MPPPKSTTTTSTYLGHIEGYLKWSLYVQEAIGDNFSELEGKRQQELTDLSEIVRQTKIKEKM